MARRPSLGPSMKTPSNILRATALAGALGAAGMAHAGDEVRIVGGQIETRFPAVGALLADGEWFCTGTAIGRRVILTAGHCLDGMTGEVEFFLGADANHPQNGKRFSARSIHPHPNYSSDDNYDVGIVVLDDDVGVDPIPARLDPLGQDIIGRDATFVGYGLTVQDGDGGEKRSVAIPISEVNNFFIGYATPNKNTCNGDSGGPALMDIGHGLEVIGVTSYGDAGCTEYGYNTRPDVFASWIQAFLDGNIPDAPPAPTGEDDVTVDGGDGGDGGDNGDNGDNGDLGDGDFCADLGWYNDDYCDEDCPKPDPDCDGANAGDDGGEVDGGDWTDGEDDGGDWTDEGDDTVADGGDDAVSDDNDDAAPSIGDKNPPANPPTKGDGEINGGCTGGAAPTSLLIALAGLALLAWRRRGTMAGE